MKHTFPNGTFGPCLVLGGMDLLPWDVTGDLHGDLQFEFDVAFRGACGPEADRKGTGALGNTEIPVFVLFLGEKPSSHADV